MAGVEDQDAVGEGEGLGDVVHGEDGGLVAPDDLLEDGGALDVVEGGDGFVAEDDGAAVVEGAGDGGALLLAAGEGAGRGAELVREADLVEDIADLGEFAGAGPDEDAEVVEGGGAVQAAHEDVVEDAEGGDEGGALGDEGGLASEALVEEVEQGALAGAGAAEEGDALALVDV